MTRASGFRVAATVHAAERARLRVPELRGATRSQASFWTEREVQRALQEGRKARRCPRFCAHEWETGERRRARARREGTSRFVWDEEETVAFLVVRTRDRAEPTLSVWVVVTVFVAPGDRPAAVVSFGP